MIATGNLTPLDHYEHAEHCGKQGQACVNAGDIATQLRDLIAQSQSFKGLEQQKEQIRLRFYRELHISECQQAKKLYESTRIQAGIPLSRLDEWWRRESARACDRLRQQSQSASQESGIFAQIEPWICILILTGTVDSTTRAQIMRLHGVVDDLERKVEIEIRDFEASAHSEYHTLEQKDVLRCQIDFCDGLRKELRDPQLAIQVCSPYIENGAAQEQRLREIAKRLDEWLSRLKGFERDLSTTIALVNYGLLNDDFQPADNALALASGGQRSPAVPSVPQPGLGFQGFTLHPTFIWLKDFIGNQKQRRTNQIDHKQYIDWGLPLERVHNTSELDAIEARGKDHIQGASGALSDKYTRFIEDMRHILAVGRFPLERVFERLKKMQSDEPEDVCHLQAQLIYIDPETLMQHIGLAEIHPVLETKVNQIQNLREWLDQFKTLGPQITIRRTCPGIVNWKTEKSLIEKQRDQCELRAALEHCRYIRWGKEESDPLFNGLWPLERAKSGLKMLPDELSQPKSAIARTLNTERLDRIEELETQITECQTIAQDIEWRIQEQPKRRDEVLEQFNFLSEARNSLWKNLPWGKRKIEDAKAALDDACKRYAQVCPCESWFRKFVDDENVSIALPRCES